MPDTHVTGGELPVRFEYPAGLGSHVVVVGNFNDWDATAHPLDPVANGFALTVSLPVGRCYRYRFLIDGERWDNDWDADGYVANAYGSDDSLLDLRDTSSRRRRSPPSDQPAVEHTESITATLVEQAVDTHELSTGQR